MFEQKKPHMVEYVQYTTHVYIKTLNIIYCLRTTEIASDSGEVDWGGGKMGGKEVFIKFCFKLETLKIVTTVNSCYIFSEFILYFKHLKIIDAAKKSGRKIYSFKFRKD